MALFRAISVGMICLAIGGMAQSYQWQQIGLSGKTVLSIAVDPDDGQRIIAGTDAGLFVTPDGGNTWYARIASNLSFPDVAYAPLANDSIFCLAAGGSFSDGLYCSEDGGNSWDVVAYYTNPRRMGFDMGDAGLMYICFGDGILKSEDYGQTFTPANTGLPGTDINDVMGDGSHSLEAYAAGSNFMAHTSNFANTWSQMSGTFNIPGHYPNRIAFEPNGSETLYVACDQFIAVSINGGLTWNYTSMDSSGIEAITCDPITAGEVYVGSAGGGGVYKSIDACGSFFAINNGLGNLDVHSLAINPNGNLLAGTGDGLYKVDMSTVSIDRKDQLPRSIALVQNYPNPFNGRTIIEVNLDDNEAVRVEVFDIGGRLVRALFNGSGSAKLTWDGTNDKGLPVGSGIYFCRLTWNSESIYHRMTLLK